MLIVTRIIFWFFAGTFLIYSGLVAYLWGPYAQTHTGLMFLFSMICIGILAYILAILELYENS